jgi:hypothetical protein
MAKVDWLDFEKVQLIQLVNNNKFKTD